MKTSKNYIVNNLPKNNHTEFNQTQHEIINRMPKFVNKKKMWILFNRFLGYAIKKMIVNNFNDKVKSSNLICENIIIEYDIFKNVIYRNGLTGERIEFHKDDEIVTSVSMSGREYVESINGIELSISPSIGELNDAKHRKELFISKLRRAIKSFNNPKVDWVPILDEIYFMAQIEPYARNGNFVAQGFKARKFTLKEKLDVILYLRQIEIFVKKFFENTKEIHLSPLLDVDDIKGDCDIICDDTIYEFKGTHEPHLPLKGTYYRLLAYTSMIERYKQIKQEQNDIKNKEQTIYLNRPKYNIKKIGIMDLQSLTTTTIDIADWNERLEFYQSLANY